MELSELIYPNMRTELVNYLRTINDLECSLDDSDFNDVVHFLFDDTWLSHSPEKLIGYMLLNNKEVFLVRRLIDSFNEIFSSRGTELSIKDYIIFPEWKLIVSSANELYHAISESS